MTFLTRRFLLARPCQYGTLATVTCIIKKTRTGYSAYIEESPDCVSRGATLHQVTRLICQSLCSRFKVDTEAVLLTFKSENEWCSITSPYPVVVS